MNQNEREWLWAIVIVIYCTGMFYSVKFDKLERRVTALEQAATHQTP